MILDKKAMYKRQKEKNRLNAKSRGCKIIDEQLYEHKRRKEAFIVMMSLILQYMIWFGLGFVVAFISIALALARSGALQ